MGKVIKDKQLILFISPEMNFALAFFVHNMQDAI